MPNPQFAMPPAYPPQPVMPSGYVAPAAPPPAAQPDPMAAALMNMMQSMQNQINALAQNLPPQQIGPALNQPQVQLPETLPQEPEAGTDLSSLGIPWLSLESAPPQIDVLFNLGASGGIRTRYHHVEITDTSIILFFDTRSEYATEFNPPFTRPESTPPLILQIGKSKAQFVAHHLPGLDFAFGVFHVTLLLRELPEPEEKKDPANIL